MNEEEKNEFVEAINVLESMNKNHNRIVVVFMVCFGSFMTFLSPLIFYKNLSFAIPVIPLVIMTNSVIRSANKMNVIRNDNAFGFYFINVLKTIDYLHGLRTILTSNNVIVKKLLSPLYKKFLLKEMDYLDGFEKRISRFEEYANNAVNEKLFSDYMNGTFIDDTEDVLSLRDVVNRAKDYYKSFA